MTSEPQHQVAHRLADGDHDALEECYRTLAPLVRSYLRRFLPADEVDDVCQITFLGLWQSRHLLDAGRQVEPLLFSIARRKAIDVLRRRHQVVDVTAVRDLVGDDGDALVERLVWAGEVRTALQALGDDQRRAIELAYFSGLTQREIAQRLGVPLGTIKARTARGLSRLGVLLERRSTP